MTAAAEETRVIRLFQRVERLEAVAGEENIAEILEVAHGAVQECEPVSVATAARLLKVSRKTVEAWAGEGLLAPASGDLLLDAERLYEVLQLVRDLQAKGRDRTLLEAAWYRLSEQALAERVDLAESVEQMKRGEGLVVRSGDSASSQASSIATG
ncbi:hypothetical protein [Actinoplanes derwentensis]|nr:hypothetical protein [Actinoplanes derwentensis]